MGVELLEERTGSTVGRTGKLSNSQRWTDYGTVPIVPQQAGSNLYRVPLTVSVFSVLLAVSDSVLR